MAYSINGKVYTDHPLMDEIVYNCKLILDGIVIKNDVLANDNEDASFIDEVEAYYMIKNGAVSFDSFPFTAEILQACGYNYSQIKAILVNRYNVPSTERSELVKNAAEYFMEHYEEKNNYYRMLIGLPPYGTDEYNVYINSSYIPANYDKDIDFTKPIHELDNSVISILQSTGKINELLETYKGSNYAYLRYMGDLSIDLYKARKANKYDILYIPAVETLVKNRFTELYNLNRDICLKRTYSEAFAYSSDYYEQCMIIMILAQTFNDMIVDVPEWYIRRDVFDIRSVQYFLESYGVEFFKEIPLKYQIRIVKNLNKLIKYKSSNKNFNDILEIFDLNNTSIFKYYLYKKRLKDSNGNYIEGESDKDKYDLEFVQAKIGESYDDYIKDLIYRTPYDDITYQDKYWDGNEDHSLIKNKHLERDFTIEGTKYMSIEYKISLTEYLFQMQYFLGLIMNSKIDSNDLKIAIPTIENGMNIKLSDLYMFLCLITLAYDDSNTDIIRPRRKDSNEPIDFTNIKFVDELYDWMKDKMPEFFVESKERVYGFNSEVDIEKLSEIIGRRHSAKQFDSGYTLKELFKDKDNQIYEYIVPTKISTIEELTNIYFNNKKCHDILKRKMTEEADNRDSYMTMKYVFGQLFTKKFDYDYYMIDSESSEIKKLENVLKDKDYILYSTYTKIISETNMEKRRDNIRTIMNDIINTLEYYLSNEGLQYVFAFATSNSFNSLINYIYLLINFFKSYKVYFLEPFVNYHCDDKLENTVNVFDSINEKKLKYWKSTTHSIEDEKEIIVTREFEDDHKKTLVEYLDISGYFEADPNDDYDYDGMYIDNENVTEFKDANGGIANEKINLPFVMLDSGSPSQGIIDLWDLNGHGASNIQEANIDGGGSFNPEDCRKDHWNADFNFDIDGGSVSANQFLTRSPRMKVKDEQEKSTIKISELQGNKLIEKDHDLYFQQEWDSWVDIDKYKNSGDTIDYVGDSLNTHQNSIEMSSDEVLINKDIDYNIEDYLSELKPFTTPVTDSDFYNGEGLILSEVETSYNGEGLILSEVETIYDGKGLIIDTSPENI